MTLGFFRHFYEFYFLVKPSFLPRSSAKSIHLNPPSKGETDFSFGIEQLERILDGVIQIPNAAGSIDCKEIIPNAKF
jgi:hypothetical protein